MLDLSVYKSRYFPIKLDENNTINIEAPKRKQLKKIISLTKSVNDQNFSEDDRKAIAELRPIRRQSSLTYSRCLLLHCCF